MKVNNLHIAVLIGLLCGIALCTVSDSKPAYTAATKLSSVQIPMRSPSSILLMNTPSEQSEEILTSTVTPLNQEYATPTILSQPVIGSDQEAIDYIFHKESTNRLDAVNENGCIGLGQDCNGALVLDCPNWEVDLDCQMAFWDRYAIARYGDWQNALYFRSTHNWW